jgi:hypothetical protein
MLAGGAGCRRRCCIFDKSSERDRTEFHSFTWNGAVRARPLGRRSICISPMPIIIMRPTRDSDFRLRARPQRQPPHRYLVATIVVRFGGNKMINWKGFRGRTCERAGPPPARDGTGRCAGRRQRRPPPLAGDSTSRDRGRPANKGAALIWRAHLQGYFARFVILEQTRGKQCRRLAWDGREPIRALRICRSGGHNRVLCERGPDETKKQVARCPGLGHSSAAASRGSHDKFAPFAAHGCRPAAGWPTASRYGTTAASRWTTTTTTAKFVRDHKCGQLGPRQLVRGGPSKPKSII